jgi:NIMA (never in mitosis gene a)-related kinase 1/4/5
MSLNDFEIISKLGEGSYSSVFKVKRLSDNSLYALKKVHLPSLKSKEKSNALTEVRILASISHPHIISYKHAFFDDPSQSLCIITEFADGGDLYQRILSFKKKSTLMSEPFLWHILIQLCEALRSLHALNVMHRDLKSANVFLTKTGDVKLGDLNVSKVAKERMNHTQTGTPYYASPEVWKDEPYDTKSDIWSLGCVVYEAAALRPPFQAEDMKSLYGEVVKGVFAPLRHFSQDLNDVVAAMLRTDPEKRPSAKELLRMAEVRKRMGGRNEGEKGRDRLMKTIRIESGLERISELLPEAKYEEEEKRKLPRIGKMNRGVTYKSLEEDRGKIGEFQRAVLRNLSVKPAFDKKTKIRSILKENYGAFRLPKVKYPYEVNVMKDVSPLGERKKEHIRLPLLPEFLRHSPEVY